MKPFLHVLILTFSTIGYNADPILEDPSLLSKPSSNIFVSFPQSLDPIYDEVLQKDYPTRGDKIEAIRNGLRRATNEWHEPILKNLQGYETESFWVSNKIFIKNANPTLINYLLGQPSIESIYEDRIVAEILTPKLSQASSRRFKRAEGEPDWDIKKIGAPQVWPETEGEGTLVCVIDTGVRKTHQSLAVNYVGTENYGWYDPVRGSQEPFDDQGHGTACTSLVVGANGVGVAPKAKWSACKGCFDDGCYNSHLLKCCQWSVCPTDPSGMNSNCSRAPKVVSNSWGGPPGTEFDDVIKAWNKAGIIPVFAVGNSGPSCRTAAYPATNKLVISVGATDINDKLTDFSSRGPKRYADGETCPQIVAPGENINVAGHQSDDQFIIQNGTSFSCPEVAGGIALLLSKKPDLTFKLLKEHLFNTTERKLPASGRGRCGAKREDQFPNEMTGWGRMQIDAAYKRMMGS